jgi:glycosyltransferase involved in cell wall biosynthesis
MEPLSACIISFNEADRIAACIESLAFCDEILVLDSRSTDRTREIATALGARVEIQEFLGHRRQKQRAVELARHDWVISLDCDEIVTTPLGAEIQARRAAGLGDAAAFSMPRRNIYLGRRMRHGFFWPDRKVRWFDRRRARWGGTDPHDRVEPDQGVEVVLLHGEILHDSFRSLADARKTNREFAMIAARALAAEGRRASVLTPWLRSAAVFFKCMGPKLAFLDGWRGVLAAWMSARHNYWKYSQLRVLQGR